MQYVKSNNGIEMPARTPKLLHDDGRKHVTAVVEM
jgi:hypothetical protein